MKAKLGYCFTYNNGKEDIQFFKGEFRGYTIDLSYYVNSGLGVCYILRKDSHIVKCISKHGTSPNQFTNIVGKRLHKCCL